MSSKFGVKHSCWKQPQLVSKLTSTGGLIGKCPMPVESAIHPVTKDTYVKMNKSERWLQKIVAGLVSNSCLNHTTLLEQLLEKMNAGGEQSPLGGDELMGSLEYDDGVACPGAPAAHGDGKEPTGNIRMNTIIKVRMPAVCPTATAHGDGQSAWCSSGTGGKETSGLHAKTWSGQ